jgi:hypothetical protein
MFRQRWGRCPLAWGGQLGYGYTVQQPWRDDFLRARTRGRGTPSRSPDVTFRTPTVSSTCNIRRLPQRCGKAPPGGSPSRCGRADGEARCNHPCTKDAANSEALALVNCCARASRVAMAGPPTSPHVVRLKCCLMAACAAGPSPPWALSSGEATSAVQSRVRPPGATPRPALSSQRQRAAPWHEHIYDRDDRYHRGQGP